MYRDNLKTILFLTETKQTSLSASQPLRCQICLALKVILRYAWTLRFDPVMQVDSIETAQNKSLHEVPLVACLYPFLILLNRPLNATEKMCGWNWVNYCCRLKSHICKRYASWMNLLIFPLAPSVGAIFQITKKFYNRSLSQETQHLIYSVKIAAP